METRFGIFFGVEAREVSTESLDPCSYCTAVPLLSAMKSALPITIALSLISCSPPESEVPLKFSVTPFGERTVVTRTDEQEGDDLPAGITTNTFKEVTIAQGSGLDGFDSIRVFSSGEAYMVFPEQGDTNQKATFTLMEDDLAGLIGALNADRIDQIKGSYSTKFWDGVQGFIEIKTSEGRRYCRLSNHFAPLTNTFHFCNSVILPKIARAHISENGINRFTEYDRVFSSKNPQ